MSKYRIVEQDGRFFIEEKKSGWLPFTYEWDNLFDPLIADGFSSIEYAEIYWKRHKQKHLRKVVKYIE